MKPALGSWFADFLLVTSHSGLIALRTSRRERHWFPSPADTIALHQHMPRLRKLSGSRSFASSARPRTISADLREMNAGCTTDRAVSLKSNKTLMKEHPSKTS
jgi:hypothetical protein